MPLQILMQEKITQTSSANSEHKHSKVEHFSTLNNELVKRLSLSISSMTCTNQSLNQSSVLGVD